MRNTVATVDAVIVSHDSSCLIFCCIFSLNILHTLVMLLCIVLYMCTQQDQVMSFVRQIFSFDSLRYTMVDELSEDILSAARQCATKAALRLTASTDMLNGDETTDSISSL